MLLTFRIPILGFYWPVKHIRFLNLAFFREFLGVGVLVDLFLPGNIRCFVFMLITHANVSKRELGCNKHLFLWTRKKKDLAVVIKELFQPLQILKAIGIRMSCRINTYKFSSYFFNPAEKSQNFTGKSSQNWRLSS